MSIKKAIANYINARAKKLTPCKHNWELLKRKDMRSKLNTDYIWTEYTYVCRKCKRVKKIDTQFFGDNK